MARYPCLLQEMLYPAAGEEPIALGTPAWLNWISDHTAFTYQDATLRCTVRCEERPGGLYWYAYKRVHGKLNKRYLGRGNDLTVQRFQEVAQSLLAQHPEVVSSPALPSPLATRFALPRLAPGYVPRQQLLERFMRGIERPCVLVTASAGSGKTTLLTIGCEHQRALGWQIAWLALEESERDPARFWLYVLTAIERVLPGATSSARLVRQDLPLPDHETLLTELINTLTVSPTPLLLVLDDYHLAETEATNSALLFLIQHMPRTLRLIISSRNELALSLARLRVQGHLAEFRQDDLRFSVAEVGLFLDQTMGLCLTPELVETLEARTEGWIAGLQLAALSLTGQADITRVIADFTGNNRYIGEYLMDEVINRQPQDVQDFLLRTAILPRMCDALCDAVTGQRAGQEMLKRLEASNLFLVSLDQQQSWYRYHHLFAEMLRERLAQQNALLWASCHERAARWFAEHGDTRAAIKLALDGQIYALAAELILAETEPMLQQGEIATLAHWFAVLPPSTLDAYPYLRLNAILVWLLKGKVASATQDLQRLTERLAGQQIEPALRGALRGVQAFQLLLSCGDMNLALEYAAQALQDLPPEQSFIGDLAALLHAAMTILFTPIDPSSMLQMLTRTALSSMRRGNYPIAFFALENRTLKEFGQGRLHQAEYTCREALHMATLLPEHASTFSNWANLQLGNIYRERNQIELAREILEYGLMQQPLLEYPESAVDGYLALARTYHALGDNANADRIMHEIEYNIQLTPVMPHTAWQIEACRARLQLAWGNLAEAVRWAQRFEEYIQQSQGQSSPILQEWSNFTLARIKMAQGEYTTAQRLLEHLLTSARSAGRGHAIIEGALLLALTEQALGRTDRLPELLSEALQLAAPEGFVRLFLEEGQPMLDLLARYLTTRVLSPAHYAATAGYARLLLAQNLDPATPATGRALPDALSVREAEILRLLAAGKSNEAIASELILALSTVKWHSAHLYRKLGVHTRLQAVARARVLNLLAD